MDLDKIKFQLTLTAILVVSAFMPILNILIMYLNAAILSVFGDSSNVGLWANLVLSIMLLLIFYLNKKRTTSMIIQISMVLFLFPLFIYILENEYNEEASYFVQSLIGGVLTGGVLIIAGLSKRKCTI